MPRRRNFNLMAWRESQYQRRADWAPDRVNSVKRFAQREKEFPLCVINARDKVGSIQVTPEALNDPAAFAKISGSKLLVVTDTKRSRISRSRTNGKSKQRRRSISIRR